MSDTKTIGEKAISKEMDLNMLLDQEDPPLDAILKDTRFIQSVRTGQTKLTSFLISDKTFPILLDLVLTKKCDPAIYGEKCVRNAMIFFTSNTYSIQEKIREHPIFIDRISNFQNSENILDPGIAGNFQRIIDSVVRQTQGEYLSRIPSMHKFLIQNINIFGYRELFITLSTDFMRSFGVNTEMIKELASYANSPSGFNVSSAMRQMLKLKRELIPMFDDVDVIETLLKTAIMPSHPLISFELFQVIDKVLESSKVEAVQNIVNKYSDLFKFEEHPLNFVRATAIGVFLKFPHDLILNMFATNPYAPLNVSIIRAVNKMTDPELIQLNNEYDLVNKIMEFVKTPAAKTNAQVWELGESLRDVKEITADGWRKFLSDVLEPHLHMRDGIYGGERPHEESSDFVEYVETPTPFIAPAFTDMTDSSSSDTSSDEENDIGGFENAKYFAKLAEMDDLYEFLDEQQKLLRSSEKTSTP